MQMQNKKGDTLFFRTPPSVLGYAAVGGKKESEGPLADGFDVLDTCLLYTSIATACCGARYPAQQPHWHSCTARARSQAKKLFWSSAFPHFKRNQPGTPSSWAAERNLPRCPSDSSHS